MEQALQETFILSLFHNIREGTPGSGVTRLPVKQAVLALPYLTNTVPENLKAYCVITGYLVIALRGQEEFRTADYSSYLQEWRAEARKRSVLQADKSFVETLAGAPVQDACRLRQETKTGSWLTMHQSTVNWTKLGAQ